MQTKREINCLMLTSIQSYDIDFAKSLYDCCYNILSNYYNNILYAFPPIKYSLYKWL